MTPTAIPLATIHAKKTSLHSARDVPIFIPQAGGPEIDPMLRESRSGNQAW